MRKLTIINLFLIVFSTTVAQAAGRNNDVTIEDFDCPEEGLHCYRVTGHAAGNHELDCTVIRPWNAGASAGGKPYPVIAWANGWEQGNVLGQCTTNGYLPGLKQWALDGEYIVVAANQWSVQESDVLACLEWTVANEPANKYLTGLAGHSQGGGAVIKAGDGLKKGVAITATIAMNPYGPSWVDSGSQDGQMLLLGGTADTTTPVSSFLPVWEAIQVENGGILAVLEGGTHNSEAWGTYANGGTMSCEDAAQVDFGQFQEVTELWWQWQLNANRKSGRDLTKILQADPWDSSFAPPDILEP